MNTFRAMATTAAESDAAGTIAIPGGTGKHRTAKRGGAAAPFGSVVLPGPEPGLFATPFSLPGMDSYPGGKGADGTFQRLINCIPPHHHYVEPFLGGGAIMRKKRPAPGLNLGIEKDKEVFQLWRDQAPPFVQVVHADGMDWLMGHSLQDELYATGRTFLFIDPPYLDDTLKTGRVPYRHGLTYDQHVAMLDLVELRRRTTDNLMMVCALPNVLYENKLRHWNTFQYQNKTRRGMQTEQVWFNYDEPHQLHDYRYLGADYRERERIRRKQKNKLRELASLPVLEREAMLQVIKTAYP